MKKLIFLFLFSLFSINVSPSIPIVKAIKEGNLERIKELIDVGIDPGMLVKRKYKKYTETLLHRAIYEEKPEVLRFLIEVFKEKGISIDKMGTCKESALMYACAVGLSEYAKILVKNGADVNFDNGDGVTPFICTVFAWGPVEDRLKNCRMLKKAGARLSLRFEDFREIIEYGEDAEVLDFTMKNMTIGSKIKLYLSKGYDFLYRILPG